MFMTDFIKRPYRPITLAYLLQKYSEGVFMNGYLPPVIFENENKIIIEPVVSTMETPGYPIFNIFVFLDANYKFRHDNAFQTLELPTDGYLIALRYDKFHDTLRTLYMIDICDIDIQETITTESNSSTNVAMYRFTNVDIKLDNLPDQDTLVRLYSNFFR